MTHRDSKSNNPLAQSIPNASEEPEYSPVVQKEGKRDVQRNIKNTSDSSNRGVVTRAEPPYFSPL